MKFLSSFNEYKLNEEIYIASKRKLRDAIHEIVVKELDYGEEMTLVDLSKNLKIKFNINISDIILKKLIFDNWWKKENSESIFRDIDKKWLDVWIYKNTIERKKLKFNSPLGKSRKKIEKEERLKNFYPNYDNGNWYY